MEVDNLPKHTDSFLMEASYEIVIQNIDSPLDTYIVFEYDDVVIEVPKTNDARIKTVDKLINYFISIEDYEKCTTLQQLKLKII
jgi:hypothetical protein